jgi:predicted permease
VLKNLTKESLFQLSGSLIYPVGAVIISYILAYALVKILKIRPGRRGIFMNAVVNANTIFIGLPLNIALFGEKALPYFLVYYVTNTVSTWAFGVFLISNDDPTKVKGENKAKLNWKKLLPPPLLGFIVAIVFLLIGIPVPGFINATLGYVGSIVTPLSLLYIGIVLYDAGLKSIRFDRDTVVALLGRFVLAPAVLIALIAIGSNFFGANLAPLLKQTLVVQSATPMLAVLPILANEAHGDVKYATNLVTTSTILFVVVVPILMELVQFI